MILNSFKYFPHTLQFKSDFKTSTGKLKSRKVFIIKLKDENGISFFGEAAPLPEFGSESFEDVEKELISLSQKDSFQIDGSLQEIFTQINSYTNLPTIQFALEQIFITAMLKRNNSLMNNFEIGKEINVNAVMGIESFVSAQEKLKVIIDSDFKVIKLKTGDENFEEVLNLLSWAIGELQAKVKFRIDPNQSWDVKKTILRSERLALLPVEYIEQPVKNFDDLVETSQKSSIPIAADESVRTIEDAEKIINNSKVKFLVIKPALFGGLGNIFQLKNQFQNNDVKIVVSSAFESNIGRRHLALIAALINNNIAHGLATSEHLLNQPCEDVFPIENGLLNFSMGKYNTELKPKF
ncbi:MAG: o-succinylbenzoate synthase [Melioribacteraceae bacterium]|nr:o-succinylbenzoate synthase [Melioribacteraceae bacterium]